MIRIVRCSLFLGFEDTNQYSSGHDDCDYGHWSKDPAWNEEKDPWKDASWEGELWGSETASVPSPSSEVVSLPSALSMPDLEDLDISGLATPPRMFGDFHVSVS